MSKRTLMLAAALSAGGLASGAASAAECGKGTITMLRLEDGARSSLWIKTTEQPRESRAYSIDESGEPMLQLRRGDDTLRWEDRMKMLLTAFVSGAPVVLTSTGAHCTGGVDEWQIQVGVAGRP